MPSQIAQGPIRPSTEGRLNRLQLSSLCMVVALVVTLAIDICVAADDSDSQVVAVTPGTSYSRSAASGWQASTQSDDVRDNTPRSKSLLTIRAYGGFENLRPYYGDELAYGIDVTSEIEECPDGNSRISALNIGGWLYEVDGDCSDYHRRSQISVSAKKQNNEEEKQDEAVMRCDPATQRCKTDFSPSPETP